MVQIQAFSFHKEWSILVHLIAARSYFGFRVKIWETQMISVYYIFGEQVNFWNVFCPTITVMQLNREWEWRFHFETQEETRHIPEIPVFP